MLALSFPIRQSHGSRTKVLAVFLVSPRSAAKWRASLRPLQREKNGTSCESNKACASHIAVVQAAEPCSYSPFTRVPLGQIAG